MDELGNEERWSWIGLLLLAGDSQVEGHVCITNNMGYLDEQICELLNVSLRVFKKAKEKMVKFNKIKVLNNNVIQIVNWGKYQSEYRRQRKYRESYNQKLQPKVTPESDTLEERREKEEKDKEKDKEKERSENTPPNPPKEEKPSYKYKKKHLDEARYLESAIKETNLKHTIRGENYLESWANTFRIMEEKKEASLEEIRLMIDFAMGSSFWHSNILSADKLREQFGRLWEQAKEKEKTSSDRNVGKRKSEKTEKEKEYWKQREIRIKNLKKEGLNDKQIQAQIKAWSDKYWGSE